MRRRSAGGCTAARGSRAQGTLRLRAPKTPGRLPPLRDRFRPLRDRDGGRRMSSAAAQIFGAVGALGLALLLVAAPRRPADRRARRLGDRGRRAGRLPGAARPPPRACRRRGGRRRRRASAGRGSCCACRGCSPSRRSRACPRAHPGARRLDPGEPPAAALRGRRGGGDRLRLAARRRRQAGPRARSARVAARLVRRLGGPVVPVDEGRRGRARSSCSSSFCRSACLRSRSRDCPGRAPGCWRSTSSSR